MPTGLDGWQIKTLTWVFRMIEWIFGIVNAVVSNTSTASFSAIIITRLFFR